MNLKSFLKLFNISNKNFLTDKSKNNISDKNPFYGEYTFHYNLWKNNIDRTENNWIGFCQYRKFWAKIDRNIDNISFKEFNNQTNIELATKNDQKLVLNDEFINITNEEINNAINNLNNNLSKIENIKKFFLIKEKFSIENGMLTPTLKLKRYKIINKYKNNFEKLYN